MLRLLYTVYHQLGTLSTKAPSASTLTVNGAAKEQKTPPLPRPNQKPSRLTVCSRRSTSKYDGRHAEHEAHRRAALDAMLLYAVRCYAHVPMPGPHVGPDAWKIMVPPPRPVAHDASWADMPHP